MLRKVVRVEVTRLYSLRRSWFLEALAGGEVRQMGREAVRLFGASAFFIPVKGCLIGWVAWE
jgi:hypothetical protein